MQGPPRVVTRPALHQHLEQQVARAGCALLRGPTQRNIQKALLVLRVVPWHRAGPGALCPALLTCPSSPRVPAPPPAHTRFASPARLWQADNNSALGMQQGQGQADGEAGHPAASVHATVIAEDSSGSEGGGEEDSGSMQQVGLEAAPPRPCGVFTSCEAPAGLAARACCVPFDIIARTHARRPLPCMLVMGMCPTGMHVCMHACTRAHWGRCARLPAPPLQNQQV